MNHKKNGFTLIELLVAMTIMAMLMAVALFSYQGARKSARDGRRRADLEQIRSALEMCRTDAGSYPDEIYDDNDGDEIPDISCDVEGESQVYLTGTPKDPSTINEYYYSSNGIVYTLCAFLETGGEDSCGDDQGCGVGKTCNYKTSNP